MVVKARKIDTRIQELKDSPHFPKTNTTVVLRYFFPEIPASHFFNAFSGRSISETSINEVIEAVRYVFRLQERAALEKADKLMSKAVDIEAGVNVTKEEDIDPRIQIQKLKDSPHFPKTSTVAVFKYFFPKIPVSRFFNAFSGGSMSKSMMLWVIEVVRYVFRLREQVALEKAERLRSLAADIEAGVMEGGACV